MGKVIKIAIISETFPPQGISGVSSAHYNLYRLLKENDQDVKVFTYNDTPENYKSQPVDPDVFHYGISTKIRRQIQFLIPKLYKYQRKLFYKTDTFLLAYQLADIIISNFGSRKLNKQLKEFNPQMVIIPDQGVPGFSIKKLKGAKYIHVSHHNPIRFINNPFFGYHSEYDALMAVKIERLALKKIDHVICPSNYMKDVFISTFGDKIPITIIPNLIDNNYISDITPISVSEQLFSSPHVPVVYIPSGGSPLKGERFVVEIIRRLAVKYEFNIGFYVSGGLSVMQRNELEKLELFSKLIYSPGYVENEQNIALIKSCSVCVSPTLIENFSMAILEANFCNIPVVAFDVGGNKEIIENGQNGYIVPYLDIETIIQKVNEILLSKTKLNTLNWVKEKFSGNALNKEYLNFIDPL